VKDGIDATSRAGASSGSSITAVAQATDDTRHQLDDISRAIDSLKQLSEELTSTVRVFH
jgi:ABC-type transporter Mla subunit MlaD